MPLRFRTAAAAILTVLFALGGCRPPAAPPAPGYDLLIRGGRVVDGSGAPGRQADVAVRDGRIVGIGTWPEPVHAVVEIDAAGLIVAPGFVDMHSHADLILLSDLATQRRLLANKLLQGVTTVVVGNCGLGVAPATPDAAEILAGVNGWMTPDGVAAGPMSIADYLDRLEAGGVVVNVATLVPHGPVRISVMGLDDGPPGGEGIERMRAALASALEDGAFGLSVGLIYPPGMYASTAELISLAQRVAERDRLFTAHIRGSSETLIPATRELIEIGRTSGVRVHHSHLEAVGEPFWDDVNRVLALEDDARAAGVRISHDMFPYTRAATMMAAIFPPWSLRGGIPALQERLGNPVSRERIRNDIDGRSPEWPPWVPGGWPHNLVGAVGWDGIIVASVPPGGPVDWIGHDLASVAKAEGRDPFDVVADLMIVHGGQVGQQVAEISGREQAARALSSILRHPAAAIVSDAEDYGRGSPHPAHAGAFARVLRLSREENAMALEDAVHRMSAYPASIVGLDDRGSLRIGAPADLVVFEPDGVTDRATWESPRLPAVGVRWVILNGEIVVENGAATGGRPAGCVLRAGNLEEGN